MRNAFQRMEFFETYYFANLIHNIIQDPMPFVRNLDQFYGDLLYKKFLAPFPKFSALHDFIGFILEEVIDEGADDVALDRVLCTNDRDLWVTRYLRQGAPQHATAVWCQPCEEVHRAPAHEFEPPLR